MIGAEKHNLFLLSTICLFYLFKEEGSNMKFEFTVHKFSQIYCILF